MADPLRVIIHAGFHKTGTKSMQDMLRRYRTELGAEIRVGLKEDIQSLADAARSLSTKASLTNRFELIEAAVEMAQKIDLNDPRPLVLSSEDLAGAIPGRGKLKSYPRAALILSTIRDACHEVAGNKVDLTFVLSTRSPQSWMRSCYAQHVRHKAMTESVENYCARLEAKSDLGALVAQIRQEIAPCPVIDFSLEESSQRRLGPVEPLLDIAGVSDELRSKLTPLPAANASLPDDVLQQFLDLNRQDLPDAKLIRLKRELVQARTGSFKQKSPK